MTQTAAALACTTWIRKYGTEDEKLQMREAIRFRSDARQAIADMNRNGIGYSPAACSAQQNIVDAGNIIRRVGNRVRSRVLGY